MGYRFQTDLVAQRSCGVWESMGYHGYGELTVQSNVLLAPSSNCSSDYFQLRADSKKVLVGGHINYCLLYEIRAAAERYLIQIYSNRKSRLSGITTRRVKRIV